MYQNSYLNGNYYPNYMQTYAQPPRQENSFSDLKFVTEAEAKAYIVMPNTRVMLMDRDKSVFYIKSADSLGKSTLEAFKYSKMENTTGENISTNVDTSKFVRVDDLNNFATVEQIQSLEQKIEELKNRLEPKE